MDRWIETNHHFLGGRAVKLWVRYIYITNIDRYIYYVKIQHGLLPFTNIKALSLQQIEPDSPTDKKARVHNRVGFFMVAELQQWQQQIQQQTWKHPGQLNNNRAIG